MLRLVKKVLGDPQAKTVKRLQKRVASINQSKTDEYKKMTDKALQKKAKDLRSHITKNPAKVDDYLDDVFALTREASERILGMRLGHAPFRCSDDGRDCPA
jgi:preprotein translocase subunit SecA